MIAIIGVLIAPAAAGGAGGPRGGAAHPVHEQPQADRPGACTTTRRPSGRCPMTMVLAGIAQHDDLRHAAGAPRPASCRTWKGRRCSTRRTSSVFKEEPANSTVISLTVTDIPLPERGQARAFPARLRLCSGVINYGVCEGDWFVWGGFDGPENRSAFGPNRSRRLAEFTDGLSQTLLARRGEDQPGRPRTADTRRCPRSTTRTTSRARTPTRSPSPPSTTTAGASPQNQSEFHTEWSDGHVHAAGLHHGLAARTRRSSAGRPIRAWTSTSTARNEEDGGPTFAAINAREATTRAG